MAKSKLKKQIKKLKCITDDLYSNFVDLSVDSTKTNIEVEELWKQIKIHKNLIGILNEKLTSVILRSDKSLQSQFDKLS